MSAAPRFLVIDDERQIRRAVRSALEALQGRVVEAATGAEGLDLAAAQQPSLVVLDLGLPDREGIEVCRELRTWSQSPVLVLSAREDAREKAALLDAGADDYLTKPFDPVELLARVRALLRRSPGIGGAQRIEAGDLVIDLVQRSVHVRGERVRLTPIEWDLLVALATHPGRTLTHQHLFNLVWKERTHGDAQAYLRVHIAHLRRKIEPDPVRPRHIITEPGVGYRFAS
jgi:two-component system KDP operon response regulator KdpE